MKKLYWLSIIVILFLISGCASVPTGGLPQGAFSLSGVQYVPLNTLCSGYKITCEWDSFSQTVVLKKDGKEIKFLADSPVAVIGGQVRLLKQPARFYRGTIIVPAAFREMIIEYLVGAAPTLQPPSAARYRKYSVTKIVLDAGHGGKDPGAISRSGLNEKNINLDIAQRLKKLLEARGIAVVMTRNDDTFISLEKRAQIANRSGADLFLSVHSNANRSRALHGLEVYYPRVEADDATKVSVDASGSGYAFALETDPEAAAVVADMVFTENKAESLRVAKDVSLVMSKQLAANNRGFKPANFYVLKYTQIPSVLVEVGYLTNTGEEQKLRDASYRQGIAQMLAEVVSGK